MSASAAGRDLAHADALRGHRPQRRRRRREHRCDHEQRERDERECGGWTGPAPAAGERRGEQQAEDRDDECGDRQRADEARGDGQRLDHRGGAGIGSGRSGVLARRRRCGRARTGRWSPAGRSGTRRAACPAASGGTSSRGGTGRPGGGRRRPRRRAPPAAAPTTGPCRGSSGSSRRAGAARTRRLRRPPPTGPTRPTGGHRARSPAAAPAPRRARRACPT